MSFCFQRSADKPHPTENILALTPESDASIAVIGYAQDLGGCVWQRSATGRAVTHGATSASAKCATTTSSTLSSVGGRRDPSLLWGEWPCCPLSSEEGCNMPPLQDKRNVELRSEGKEEGLRPGSTMGLEAGGPSIRFDVHRFWPHRVWLRLAIHVHRGELRARSTS